MPSSKAEKNAGKFLYGGEWRGSKLKCFSHGLAGLGEDRTVPTALGDFVAPYPASYALG